MPTEPNSFQQRAFDYFKSQGLSPTQAAALVGNALQESGGDPTKEDPRGEGSVGLFQWRKDRRLGLSQFAAQNDLDPLAEDTQLQFAHHELTNGNERASGDALRKAGDLKSANDAVMGYLRPLGYTAADPAAGHGYDNRFTYGAQVLAKPGEVAQLPPARNVGAAPGAAATGTASIWDGTAGGLQRMAEQAAQTAVDANGGPVSAPDAATPAAAAATGRQPDPWAAISKTGKELMAAGQAPSRAPGLLSSPVHAAQQVSLNPFLQSIFG